MERIRYQDLPEGIFYHLRANEDYLKESGIDRKILELLKLRVSQLNGCAYCLDMHYKELKQQGETDLRLSMLAAWEECPLFDAEEKAALAYAEALTSIDHRPLSEAVFTEVEQHFKKFEIALLSLAITQINTWNRLMKAFQFTPGRYEVQV